MLVLWRLRLWGLAVLVLLWRLRLWGFAVLMLSPHRGSQQ
jgi:hypothetical protein